MQKEGALASLCRTLDRQRFRHSCPSTLICNDWVYADIAVEHDDTLSGTPARETSEWFCCRMRHDRNSKPSSSYNYHGISQLGACVQQQQQQQTALRSQDAVSAPPHQQGDSRQSGSRRFYTLQLQLAGAPCAPCAAAASAALAHQQQQQRQCSSLQQANQGGVSSSSSRRCQHVRDPYAAAAAGRHEAATDTAAACRQ